MLKIPAPNYTQTPNDLFDYWLPLLSESELKVLLVIMRKTFGWHKTHDVISTSQLCSYTGMLEETVIKAAKSLQSKGIVTREVIGTLGKQKTIYSLIISENSNNSYPSVKPSGPLGLNWEGSTEIQKKETSSLYKKKQQQEVAAVSQKPEKKPEVYPCLQGIDIPIKEKCEITKNYSVPVVMHAIKWALHPQTKIKKGLVQAIKWACEAQPELPKTPTDKVETNRKYALKYDGMKMGVNSVNAYKDYVEIIAGGAGYGNLFFSYDSNGFKDKFTNALRKKNFKILEEN